MNISHIRGIMDFMCGFFNLSFLYILWVKGKKNKASFYLGWAALFSAIYAFTFGGVFLFRDKLFWSRATWSGALILPAYITFSLYFSGGVKRIRLKSFLWYVFGIIIFCAAIFTPYVIKSVNWHYPFGTAEQGFLRPFGRMYIIICTVAILYYLSKEYRKSQGFRRLQTKYFILGLSIYTTAGFLFVGIAPLFFPKFTAIDLSVFASIIWVGLTTYAIFKRKLFEIEVILTEILVGLIGLLLLLQVFFVQTIELKIFEFIIFVLFCIMGYILIKTTYREIKRKEEMRILAQELGKFNQRLEKKVKERTKELEQSYKEIKKKKEEAEEGREALEKFYKLTIDREVHMINLKKKVKKLENKKNKTR